jgi:hypothetical protein
MLILQIITIFGAKPTICKQKKTTDVVSVVFVFVFVYCC